MHELTTDGELDAALAAPRFLLFKHSRICPRSARAFDAYERFVAAHPDAATAWVDVIASRPLSQRAAAATGVRHESPQVLALRAGAVCAHASHETITEVFLADAWDGTGAA